MHQYGLLDSPSFITDWDSSDEDVLNEIGKIQKLLQPKEKCKQSKSKQIFKRANDIQGPSLREYLLKFKHPIVTSTPQTDISPTNNLTLQLTPIPRRRNSIIAGHAVNHFWQSVRKPSKKNSVSVTTSTKSKLSRSNKRRKSKKHRPPETDVIDLTGIETLNKSSSSDEVTLIDKLNSQKTLTTNSVNDQIPCTFIDKLISQKTLTTNSLNNQIPQVLEGLDLGNSKNALPDRSNVHKKNERCKETSVLPEANLTNQLKNLLGEVDQTVASAITVPSTNDNVKKNKTESNNSDRHVFLKPFTNVHQLSDRKLRSAVQVSFNIYNSAEVKNVRASNNFPTTEIGHKPHVSKDTTSIDQRYAEDISISNKTAFNNITQRTRTTNTNKTVEIEPDVIKNIDSSVPAIMEIEENVGERISDVPNVNKIVEPPKESVLETQIEKSNISYQPEKNVKKAKPSKRQGKNETTEKNSQEVDYNVTISNNRRSKSKSADETTENNSQEVDYNDTISNNTRSKTMGVVVDNNKENELTSTKQNQTINRNIVAKTKRKASPKKTKKKAESVSANDDPKLKRQKLTNKDVNANSGSSTTSEDSHTNTSAGLNQNPPRRRTAKASKEKNQRKCKTNSIEIPGSSSNHLQLSVPYVPLVREVLNASEAHVKQSVTFVPTVTTRKDKEAEKLLTSTLPSVSEVPEHTELNGINEDILHTQPDKEITEKVVKEKKRTKNVDKAKQTASKTSKARKKNRTSTVSEILSLIRSSSGVESECSDGIRTRLRRTIIKPKPFIQATLISDSDLKKRLAAKSAARSKTSVTKKSNNNSKSAKNLEDQDVNVNFTESEEQSTISIVPELLQSNEDRSKKPREDCFKKPRAPPKKTRKTRIAITSVDTDLQLSSGNGRYPSTDCVDNAGSCDINGVSSTTFSATNSIYSENNTHLAGPSNSGTENDSTEAEPEPQRIIVHQNERLNSNVSTIFNPDDESAHKRESKTKTIQGVVNNRSIMFEWYSDKPIYNETENVSVVYSLSNLKSHLGIASCGFITFGPGQEKSQVPKKHIIIFKIEKGRGLVSQQFVSKVMEVEMSFYVPLGSPYKIKNMSDMEPLILYFMKISQT